MKKEEFVLRFGNLITAMSIPTSSFPNRSKSIKELKDLILNFSEEKLKNSRFNQDPDKVFFKFKNIKRGPDYLKFCAEPYKSFLNFLIKAYKHIEKGKLKEAKKIFENLMKEYSIDYHSNHPSLFDRNSFPNENSFFGVIRQLAPYVFEALGRKKAEQ